MPKNISNEGNSLYTEWCPYCGAETDYSEEWTHVKCSGCGRWLMPCDWCHVRLNGLDKPSRPIDFKETPCGGEVTPGYWCPIEEDKRFKCKRIIKKEN